MTPSEVLDTARDQFNATGDTFFTDAQLYNHMRQACNILAREADLIEAITSSSTVIATQSYSYPTNALSIKRVTYNGSKLKRLTMREDDAVTLSNQASTQSGTPVYYTDFGDTIYLRPIPDAVKTLQFWSINLHGTITASSTLTLPAQFHMDLVDYLLSVMFSKDQNEGMATFHRKLWEQHVSDAKRWKQKQKRSDSFTTVQDEERLPVTIMGEV